MAAAIGRDFFDLVKAIGESKSKQEEDRIIAEEVIFLKKAVPQISNSKKKLKELVVRAVYVEMLGQDASFAYIKAVELCASTNILQKRVGYLAASLCLSPEHEFRFMLVNQIQRDINSTNHLESCAALSAVCKIVNQDMIPAIIRDVRTGDVLYHTVLYSGDTPIIGAGTYANDATCAVSATGKGEEFMRHVAAYDVSARIEIGGLSLSEAVNDTVFKKLPAGSGGMIAVNYLGEYSMEFNSKGMFRGVCESSGECSVGIWEDMVQFQVAESPTLTADLPTGNEINKSEDISSINKIMNIT